MSDLRKLAQDIGAAPLGDLIASVGRGGLQRRKPRWMPARWNNAWHCMKTPTT
ncbi:MAG: hypothetical protein MH186_04360 [Marinobacter sp.]|nr:hypothetical protein [Marinobacter sp.]